MGDTGKHGASGGKRSIIRAFYFLTVLQCNSNSEKRMLRILKVVHKSLRILVILRAIKKKACL